VRGILGRARCGDKVIVYYSGLVIHPSEVLSRISEDLQTTISLEEAFRWADGFQKGEVLEEVNSITTPYFVLRGSSSGLLSIEAINTFIKPRLVGQDVAELNRNCALIQSSMERNTSAKAAVEIAVYDLWAQLHKAPLYQMLGGGDPVITTDITISVDYIDKMVADSLSAIERGFESLKIKVGKDIGLDIERVKAIHAAVQGRALLRLDANQGWTAKQAVHAMRTLEEAGVVLELLEQVTR
jgi:L-alanine-DL-glutamate epimerase-like enolase superfamily enzyme